MSKKSIIVAVGVVIILIVLVGASRRMNKQTDMSPQPTTNTSQPTTGNTSGLEQELNQVNTGNIDADFIDIDNDINSL